MRLESSPQWLKPDSFTANTYGLKLTAARQAVPFTNKPCPL